MTRHRLHGLMILPLLSTAILTGWPQAAWAAGPVLPAEIRLAQTNPTPHRQRVAVMDFRAINLHQSLGEATAETLRSALIQMQRVTVIERGQIEQVIHEQNFNLSGLVDGDAAMALGRLLGAGAIIVGSVAKFGDTYTINARSLDVLTGEALAAGQATSRYEEDIPSLMHTVAQTLFPKSAVPAPTEPLATARTQTPVPVPSQTVTVTRPAPVTASLQTAGVDPVQSSGNVRPTGLLKSEALLKGLLVPSWGQFYAQEPVRAWVTLGVIALGLWMTMYTSTYANAFTTFTARPYFGLGLGLAALGWVGGAVDAHIVTQEHEPLPVTGSHP